jgi:hypothetical protein
MVNVLGRKAVRHTLLAPLCDQTNPPIPPFSKGGKGGFPIRALLGIFVAIILVFIALFPIIAHAKKAPDWVNGVSKKYPEPQYFIGVGTAIIGRGAEKQQMQLASDRARAEIAKTLRVNVDVTTSAERTITSQEKGKMKESKGVSQQREVVTATAGEILDDVEIKEYYSDKKDKTLYALAILDRIKAARRLEDQATHIKSNILAEMEAAEKFQKDGRFLPAIGRYNKAFLLSAQVARLGELLGVVRPIGPSPFGAEVNNEADIKRIIDGLRNKIRFDVQLEGPAANVKTYLIEGLARAGYITKAGTGNSTGAQTYRLSGKTDITYRGTIDMGDEMKMQVYKADLEIEVEDPKTSETVGAMVFSANANDREQGAAEKAAVQALGRLVKDTIADRLANLL